MMADQRFNGCITVSIAVTSQLLFQLGGGGDVGLSWLTELTSPEIDGWGQGMAGTEGLVRPLRSGRMPSSSKHRVMACLMLGLGAAAVTLMFRDGNGTVSFLLVRRLFFRSASLEELEHCTRM